MTRLSPSEIAAWWGATVATLVLGWDIYKWKKYGPKVQLQVQADRILVGGPVEEKKTFICARAVNVGDRTTTITTFGFRYYASPWSYVRRKPLKSMVVIQPSFAQQLPFKLSPGSVWDGLTEQEPHVEDVARTAT